MRLLLLTALLAAAAVPVAIAAPNAVPAAALEATRIADRSVTIGDQTVRYLEAGRGDTLIVLVHGWPQSADEWRQVIPKLADRFRVVAPDLRGIGGSQSPSRDYSKAALARDLHSFVQSLGAKHVVLVGHDVGGMVTYAYARQFPQDLTGAAILDVPLPGFAPWEYVEKLPQAWHFDFHAQQPLAEVLVQGRQAAYFRYFIDHNGANTKAIGDQEIARFAQAYASPAQLSAGFGFYRAFPRDKEFNAAQRAALSLPLLVAGAEHSLGAGAAALAGDLRAHGASDVRVATIDKSGHWIAEEQPDAVAALIWEFAAEVGQTPR
ncbi:alpha/beta fold hydrolase [Sphingomonas xinjiangensis]|uniref:Pimeloyl-ACP methyl ester carboxylesterase n=1 Tax=Sphingomonas xinjiangensis TaxID=643568 RepID=A0A840YTX0_9SPHN|nr:alpha/beta hydrolase [Sphingomonas xinjiangensis]MBB5713063.1 pimeloyl-ACP methyl ester carboxylesterase [Sphingomonas xinjiangensis]